MWEFNFSGFLRATIDKGLLVLLGYAIFKLVQFVIEGWSPIWEVV